ncbi:MAG: hypothetical protein VX593_00340 [Pseudomonadota bacterium]|nr:hypothetical protein [Pseudomonadota bacterium]
MANVIKGVFRFGPLIFAFGFLAPLIAQLIQATGMSLPYGVTPLGAGLILAGLLGLVAQLRGRWI